MNARHKRLLWQGHPASGADRRKLDEYMTAVREIELRIAKSREKVDLSDIELKKQGSTGWPALGPTGVPAAPEVVPGLNARYKRLLWQGHPALLWKRARSQVDFAQDYHCFEIPDEFVVGYGLDFNGEYRHLPYIGVLESGSTE